MHKSIKVYFQLQISLTWRHFNPL